MKAFIHLLITKFILKLGDFFSFVVLTPYTHMSQRKTLHQLQKLILVP